MRIAIVPNLNRSAGGIYQYAFTLLNALYESKDKACADEFIVFANEVPDSISTSLNGPDWKWVPGQPPSFRRNALEFVHRIAGEGKHREAWRWLKRHLQQDPTQPILPNPDVVESQPVMCDWFQQWAVDLMLYPAPNRLSFETGLPYVMAIHDLQHRLQPEFPEVSANGEWERREYYYRNGARYATLLLADSEVGKEDIVNVYGEYGVTPDRVKVLPFLPAWYLADDISESERRRVRMVYDLPERYLFYPAQFWPHKNHLRIVQALGLLKQEHRLRIPVVLCGSNAGGIREQTFHETMSLSCQLGIGKDIHYFGYVPDEDMSAMYAEAEALVMPTFFGPTNIPILEAWAFGCPVLTSDIRGIREQVNDAAILVDPRSVDAIADGIYQLWIDESLTRRLADLGRRRLASYTADDYRQRLLAILGEAKTRVHSQGVENHERTRRWTS